MAWNSLVGYGARPEYSYTSPQEVEHTPSSLDHRRLNRHPFTAPLMKSTTTPSPCNPPRGRTSHFTGQDTLRESTFLNNHGIYEDEFQNQPNSFPQRRKSVRHSKQYSSLDMNVLSVSSSPRHHYSHHSSASGSAVSSPLSSGVVSGQLMPHLSHGDDFQEHTRQTSCTNQSSSRHSVQVTNRASEEEQTAGSVSRTEHSRHYDSSSSSAGPSSSASRQQIPKSRSLDSGDHHIIPTSFSEKYCSQATQENARYSLDEASTSDHSNEDRYFAVEGKRFKVFCVCDGHNGSRASGFASNYLMEMFYQEFWTSIVSNVDHSNMVCEALVEIFKDTEKEFFKSIECSVNEKNLLQSKIPPHLTSYAAYQQYPDEVMRLQEVEPKLTGGCTIALAITVDDTLYVANVGDSRAVLVCERNGVLVADQLTVDHTVENKDELKRLEVLGLDPRELIKARRLGTQENTRSIGDYSIKAGYKDVDSLRSASCAPGIATPYIMPTRKIDHSFKYLIVMTDGVYKSIESNFEEHLSINANKVLVSMLERSLEKIHGQFEHLSSNLLDRIATVNQDCYIKNAKKDGARSARAVACRKRDDMTLVVYRFPNE